MKEKEEGEIRGDSWGGAALYRNETRLEGHNVRSRRPYLYADV